MSDINLLPKSDTSSIKQERAVSFFRKISVIALAFTAFTSVAIFILVLLSPLSKSQQEEKNLITQLSRSSNKIGRNVIMQERLNIISNVLKTRNTFESDINALLSILPSEIEIDKMKVTSDTILITAKTESIDSANTFFSKLIELQEKNEYVKDVTLNSFALQTGTGSYNFVVEVSTL